MAEIATQNVLSTQKLLASGAHFGHQSKRWNPKMSKFIYAKKKGVHIIDLPKTVALMNKAYEFTKQTVEKGGSILFVGTKKQAKESIEVEAKRAEQFYVSQRWLGGTLTNFKTINKRIRRMSEIEMMEKEGTFEKLPKKEVILIKKEYDRLNGFLGGIRKMRKMPRALFIVDPMAEMNAVLEAKKLGIKIIAMVDTNCDPDLVDYAIPSNDDAIKSISLITKAIADACVEAKGGKPEVAFTKDDENTTYHTSKYDRPRREDRYSRPRREVKPNYSPINKNASKEAAKNEVANFAKANEKKIEAKAVKATVEVNADDLENLTLAELKEKAKVLGLSGYSAKKKSEIIEMIKGA